MHSQQPRMNSLRTSFIIVMCFVAFSNIIIVLAIYLSVINYAIVNTYIPQSIALYRSYVETHYRNGNGNDTIAHTLDAAYASLGPTAFLPPPMTDHQGKYIYPPKMVGLSFDLATRPLKVAYITPQHNIIYFIPYTHVSDYPMLMQHLWLGVSSVVVALILVSFLSFVIASRFATHIITPITTLVKASQTPLTNTTFRNQLTEHTVTEIIQLASALDTMRDEIAHHVHLRQMINADIAHEIRNPLNTVIGNLEALRDGIFQATPKHLNTIYEEATIIQRLVDDLRTMSLTDMNTLPLDLQPIPCDEFFKRISQAFLPVVQINNLILHMPTDFPDRFLFIDSGRIIQVFGNLIENAVHHCAPEDTIELHISDQLQDTFLTCTLIDSGIGIPSTEIPFVFERFFRGSHRSNTGTGLGLPIARSIIMAHGGTISLTSHRYIGTKVTFTLPFL